MLIRRASAVTIAALLCGLMLAVPAQAIINDGGGGGGGGGGPIPAVITLDDQKGTVAQIATEVGSSVYPAAAEWTGYTFTGWWTAPEGGTKLVPPIVVTGNATFYAQWTLNSYTVTFQPANGAAPTTTTADYETTISAPGQPSRANYTFAGWFTSASGGTQVTFPYMVQGDATLYAHWTGDPRTVTFAPGNGDAALVDSTEFGATIAAPAEPTRAHYSFVGWFTSASGGTQATFPYPVTTNATLYAQWTIDSHTVTFEPANGEASTTHTADYGATVSAPTDPTRAEYTFNGWFTATSGGTQATFPYTVTNDVTLYAQWTLIPYSVTFEPGNGGAATVSTVTPGTSIGAPTTPTRWHYQFAGWFTASTGGTEILFPYTPNGDATIYAQWTADTYTVVFEPGNGGVAANQQADYGTSVSAPFAPTRTGYDFEGWFTTSSGGFQVAFPYTVEGDVTLYARWAVHSYTVTFEPANGDAAIEVAADFDTTIPVPAEPSRTSHEFTGWFTAATGGTEVTFPYTVTGDATLYAHWERAAAVFSAPGQTTPGATIPVTGENFIPGESVEIWLLSTPTRLATVTVGADGTFSTTVVIPASTPAGEHHIEVRGSATVTLSSAVTVNAVLAATGTDIGGAAGLAALLMLGGLALILRKPRAA